MKLMRLAVVAAALATVLATVLAAPPGAQAAAGDGTPTDPNIRFVGRWDTRDSSAYVPGWAGAYLTTGFTGTTVRLKQRNTIDLYYSIDGRPDVYLQDVRGTVNLTPTPLPAGNHTLRVSYRVVAGSYHGDAVFQGLVLDPGARTLPAQPARGMVEFVGDSITVGTTTSKNALTAYGWLVGEQLGLDHMQVAQGGACLVTTADGCVGLDRRFVKVSAADGAVDHDFSRYQADVVVINLGTNDAGHGVSTTQFQNSYTGLLRTIRGKYPKAAILALQTFRGRFVPQTQAAVQTVNNAGRPQRLLRRHRRMGPARRPVRQRPPQRRRTPRDRGQAGADRGRTPPPAHHPHPDTEPDTEPEPDTDPDTLRIAQPHPLGLAHPHPLRIAERHAERPGRRL
ncbi:GDSL-type esterase/lipase family protein [Microbispora sp. NPDC046973]|uniref:GDSL-type esterase/lipase family protein n=1 Tax=Microbispora sp. NPDC046973 TaxID=3155022 RepID=UPI0034059DBA